MKTSPSTSHSLPSHVHSWSYNDCTQNVPLLSIAYQEFSGFQILTVTLWHRVPHSFFLTSAADVGLLEHTVSSQATSPYRCTFLSTSLSPQHLSTLYVSRALTYCLLKPCWLPMDRCIGCYLLCLPPPPPRVFTSLLEHMSWSALDDRWQDSSIFLFYYIHWPGGGICVLLLSMSPSP